MSFFDVLELLYEESGALEALFVFCAMLLLYFLTFRRRVHSPFDPLAFVLLLSACSTTILTLMTLHGAVSLEKYTFVVATLVLFYAGFLVADTSSMQKYKRRVISSSTSVHPISSLTLAVLFFANLVVLGITYVFFGIPLLLESRLAQFSESGGFGVLNRLAVGLEPVSLVMAFIALRQPRQGSWWAKAIVIQFVVAALLSGSKGSLLNGLFAWLFVSVFSQRTWSTEGRLPRPMVVFLILALLAPLGIVTVQGIDGTAGVSNAAGMLLVRLAAEGDGYAYFLGNDLIDSVARRDWIAPLRQVLVALRIVGPETALNPGFEIVREVLSIDAPSTGPNSRLPIYLLFFYGYGGIVASPLLGMALGWTRNRLTNGRQTTPMKFAIAAAVYLHFSRLEVDPQLTVAGLFGLALTLPILWIAGLLGRDSRRTRAPQALGVPRTSASAAG